MKREVLREIVISSLVVYGVFALYIASVMILG